MDLEGRRGLGTPRRPQPSSRSRESTDRAAASPWAEPTPGLLLEREEESTHGGAPGQREPRRAKWVTWMSSGPDCT